jgi:hypothetical protein
LGTGAASAIERNGGWLGKSFIGNLRQYATTPLDQLSAKTGAFTSSLLYASHLGGQTASAIVNLTQPFLLAGNYIGYDNLLKGYANAFKQMGTYIAKRAGQGFRRLGYALIDIVEPLLPPLATGFHAVLSVVGLLWMGLMDFGALIFDTLGPVFRLLSTAVGFVAQVFMDSLLIGAKVLGGVYSWFAAKLGPLFQTSVNLISETADWLIKIIQKLGIAWNEIATQASEGAVSKTFGVDDLSAWIKGLSSKVGSNEQFGPPRPPEKLKPVVNQDFRGSKFNIEMAFAKEYDPDRIATAFKAEIPKKAALESGLTPLFALM